jgi:hypothetical protein
MKRIGTASDGKFIALVDPDEAAELQTAAGKILAALNGLAPVPTAETVSPVLPERRKPKAGKRRVNVLTDKRGDGGQVEDKLCMQCDKPLPKGSKRKTHKGECTKTYAREYARKWYQQKHGKGKPAHAAPAVSVLPPETRKARLDAIREANERLREQEADGRERGAVV